MEVTVYIIHCIMGISVLFCLLIQRLLFENYNPKPIRATIYQRLSLWSVFKLKAKTATTGRTGVQALYINTCML